MRNWERTHSRTGTNYFRVGGGERGGVSFLSEYFPAASATKLAQQPAGGGGGGGEGRVEGSHGILSRPRKKINHSYIRYKNITGRYAISDHT